VLSNNDDRQYLLAVSHKGKRFGVLENRVLIRIFGSKRDEVTGD
jgi:hypothetical protein